MCVGSGPLSDVELAVTLAEAAGRLLLSIRNGGIFAGADLGCAGDKIADRFLMLALRAHRPEDGLICEESRDTLERLEKSRVWIIDPVDGSREFGEERSDWAVHVGLAIDGVASVGAVALPGVGGGIVLRSDVIAERPKDQRARQKSPRVVVSRTRPPREAVTIADRIGGEVLMMGSAGAKAMAVVRGEAEIYLHSGGQYEWDSCAPVAVALAHGLHCSRIDGGPLRYNQRNLFMPDLLICRPEWAERVVAEVRALAAEED